VHVVKGSPPHVRHMPPLPGSSSEEHSMPVQWQTHTHNQNIIIPIENSACDTNAFTIIGGVQDWMIGSGPYPKGQTCTHS